MFLFDDMTTSRALLDVSEVASIDKAKSIWESLSEHDRNLRDAFFVADSENLDTANILWVVK